LHLLERLLSLVKETKDDRSAELAILFVVIHLQDLLKGQGIDAVAKVEQTYGALLALTR
jgi:hypothetical protein